MGPWKEIGWVLNGGEGRGKIGDRIGHHLLSGGEEPEEVISQREEEMVPEGGCKEL